MPQIEIQDNARVRVFGQDIDRDNLVASELPQDLVLVEYEIDGTLYCDGVRTARQVHAFDLFYDKVAAQGGKIINIISRVGKIPPKQY